MFLYWILFLSPSFFALIGQKRKKNHHQAYHLLKIDALWCVFILMLTLIIGLRVEVGGDWFAYIRIYEFSSTLDSLSGPQLSLLLAGDPGYLFINWISHQLDLGIYGVNTICGLIFSIGLAIFCRSLPRPLLALTVSIPYMVIVVGMGYSRQAVALGVVMIGLVALARQKKLWFYFCIFIAVTLHKSAIILLPVAALASSKNKIQSIFFVGVLFAILYFNFLADPFEVLYKNYILSQDAQSQGAMIRSLMNLLPALIYLIWPHRFDFAESEKSLWSIAALISLGLFLLLIVFPDLSTAIDRVALYMLPIQLVIFSYMPEILGDNKMASQLLVFLIIFFYMSVMFVWLNFAIHAGGWLPYRNLLFEL